jgi:hypothetical protein
MAGVAFEVRQTMAETGRPAASLSSEARSAGFLLIARKSR